MLKLQDGYKPGCPLPLATNVCLRGPEPNGEVEQDLMMELDYRTLHVHVEMCVCVCIKVCLCVYLYTVIFANWTIFMYVHAICYMFIVHIFIIIYSFKCSE